MSGRLRFLVLAALLVPATAGAQSALNKCIDARGGVTYSNLPCKNAREVQKVEVDPAPPTPPAPSPAPAKAPLPDAAPATRSAPAPVPALSAPASKASRPASTAPVPPSTPPAVRSPRTPAPTAAPAPGANQQCERLSAQLGEVLDKMDQARRQGASPAQMDAWDQQARELERKKQQTGCF